MPNIDSLEYKLHLKQHQTMLDLYKEEKYSEAAMLCYELIGELGDEYDSLYKLIIQECNKS